MDLNQRPRAYESLALPLSYAAWPDGDLTMASHNIECEAMVAGAGFEPTTSGLCLLLQLPLPGEPVCSLDFPFTLGMTR